MLTPISRGAHLRVRVRRLLIAPLVFTAACQRDPFVPTTPDVPRASVASVASDAVTASTVALAPWELENPAAAHEIEGYASAPSVNKGESISLFVNTSSPTYRIDVYRMGWYGGAGALLVTSATDVTGIQQAAPVTDVTTGLTECRWINPYVLATGSDWVSGVYLAKLTASSGKNSYIIFVVRDDARASDFLFNLSINTYQAYNTWGGKSLYNGNSTGGQRANKVSLNRPYWVGDLAGPAKTKGLGAGHFLATSTDNATGGWEYNMIRFLDREGYDVTYTTDYDVHKRPLSLRNHKAFLIVGHDEYWTLSHRRAVSGARDAGVHIGVFSANTGYWQVRFESSLDGIPDRTMVGYKDFALDPVKDSTATILFRTLSMPEDRLLGAMYRGMFPVAGDMVIDDATTWVTLGSGVQSGTILPGLLGYETDQMVTDSAITGLRRIANSQYSAPAPAPQGAFAAMTLYAQRNGAFVFNTGSMHFLYGLDDYNVPDVRTSRLSSAAQQMTRNVLNRFLLPLVPPVWTVTASLAATSIPAAQTTQATATLKGPTGSTLTGREVLWTSASPAVATVDPVTGVVTALAEGTAVITATSEGVKASATLTVTRALVATVAVSLSPSSITAVQTAQATATVKDALGRPLTDRVVTWASGNTAVATVDANGLLTAVASGTTTITATSEGVPGSATLTVTAAPVAAVATVAVSLSPNTVTAVQTAQATATLTDAAGNVLTGRGVTWASSNPAVATVDGTGLVTAIAPGTATITGTSEEVSGSATLTVTPAPVATVAVSLSPSSIDAVHTSQATATVKDALGRPLTDRTVTWASSNTAVATIDPTTGAVTGESAGTTTITATSEGITGTATLTVTPAPVVTVAVTLTPASITATQTSQGTATLRDARGRTLTGRAVSWSSSATTVATISATGLATGVAAGTTTITATSEGVSGTATLTVTSSAAAVATVAVTLTPTSINAVQTSQATATLRDAAGNTLTGRTVTWSSSNTAVATVNPTTGLVTGEGPGTVVITATSEGKSGTATLTVTAAPVASVSVTLASTSILTGQTSQGTATVRDAKGRVLTGRNVNWSSTPTSVATVDANGLARGVGAGTATISAKSEGVTGTATLTVAVAPVATVAVSIASPSLGIGQTTPATATLKDAAGNTLTGRTVTWSSSNPAVATVNATTGAVKGIALGSAVITATSEGKSGSATVTVVVAPVATVTVTIVDANIAVNQTSQATATLKDATGVVLTGRTITWTSSDVNIATVSATGLVRAVGVGSVDITATSEGKSGSVRVKTRR